MKSILCLALLLVCASQIHAAGTFRSQTELDTNDLKVLNYAVFLERLGAAFYAYGQSTFNASQFASAGYSSTVYNYFGMIAQHEAAHRDLLQTTVTSLGGTLPASCNYDFSSVQTVAQYVATARQLESLDVQAYLGAASGLNSRLLLQVAATITTVEARHASFLGNLTGTGPFNTSAFDTPLDPTAVLPLAANTGFLNGCTYPTANLPTVLQVSPDFASLVYLNSSLLSNGTSIANIDQSAITANEIKVLNYALFLERLEADFYNNFTNSYSRDQFGTATGFPGFVYDYLVLIRDHENAHVNFLVGQLGSNALPSCSFTYPNLVGNVTAYLALAQVFENLGVTAYDGAIAAIHTRDTAQAAATIATIEARHAAFLNELVGAIPFSADRDTANTPTTVAGAALTYTICPAGAVPTLPDFFALVPKANATTQAPGTSTTTKAPNTNSSNSVVVCLSMLIMCIATLVL